MKFRTAWVAQNSGHDFSELLEFCDEIKFITTGYESAKQLPEAVTTALVGFTAREDVIVPVGSVMVNLLIGHVLGGKHEPYNVALYHDKTYVIYRINHSTERDANASIR